MGKSVEKVLHDVYYSLNSPASYAGQRAVYLEAKKRNPLITLKEVNNFLHSEGTYTLHMPARRRFSRLKTIPSGLHTDWQCDLCDFASISRHNGGNRFLLVCIDVLSRKMFVAPVKSKKNSDMINAFDHIFKKSIYTPWHMVSDDGKEFNGREIVSYFTRLGIIKHTMRSAPFHAAVVENANRTIKTRLYKYFSENSTQRWLDVVEKIVDNINNSVNRATGMSPSTVTYDNAIDLHKRLYKHDKTSLKSRYKIGDVVRISKFKGVFAKSYLANYTDELFKIYKVYRTQPPSYTIEDLDNKVIKGKFYEHELVLTTLDTKIRIEKVLRKRVRNGEKEALVKFMGQSGTAWVKENALI